MSFLIPFFMHFFFAFFWHFIIAVDSRIEDITEVLWGSKVEP